MKDPDVSYIGRPVQMTSRALTLATVGPDAIWNGTARTLPWGHVTRIDVGGAYEEALDLVVRSRQTSP